MNRKQECTLVEPKRFVRGQVLPGKKKEVSRHVAAGFLAACRNGKASVLRLQAGCYAILPHGLQNGFQLQTK